MKSVDSEQYSCYWELLQNSRIAKEGNQEAKQEHSVPADDFDAFVHPGKNARGWTGSKSGRDSDDGVLDSASGLDALHLDRVENRFDTDPRLSVEYGVGNRNSVVADKENLSAGHKGRVDHHHRGLYHRHPTVD